MASISSEHVSNRRAWLTLLGLVAPASLLMALDRSIVTIAAPTLQARYQLSLPELGLIFSVFSWAYALMQIPGGLLVSRFGPRLTMAVAIVLWSATTAVTPFVGSFTALLVVRVLLAVGQCPDWPASIHSIDKLFPSEGRAVANGILLFALYAGVVLGAPLASHLLVTIGLEGVFLFCGGLGIAFALVWWIFFRIPDGANSRQDTPASPVPFGQVAKSGRVWLLAIAYACPAGVLNYYLSLFPTYLAQSRGFELERMGSYAAISSSALCAAALAGGPIAAFALARAKTLRTARLPYAIASLALVAAVSIAIPWLTSDIAILIAACLSLAAIGFANVITWCVVQDIGQETTATLTGFITLAGNLAAGLLPFAVTLLVSSSGSWSSSFMLLGAIAVLGCLLWFFIDPSRPLRPQPNVLP